MVLYRPQMCALSSSQYPGASTPIHRRQATRNKQSHSVFQCNIIVAEHMSQRKEPPSHGYLPFSNFLREASIKRDPHSQRLESFLTFSPYYCCTRHCNAGRQSVLRRRTIPPHSNRCLNPACLSNSYHSLAIVCNSATDIPINQQLSAKRSSNCTTVPEFLYSLIQAAINIGGTPISIVALMISW